MPAPGQAGRRPRISPGDPQAQAASSLSSEPTHASTLVPRWSSRLRSVSQAASIDCLSMTAVCRTGTAGRSAGNKQVMPVVDVISACQAASTPGAAVLVAAARTMARSCCPSSKPVGWYVHPPDADRRIGRPPARSASQLSQRSGAGCPSRSPGRGLCRSAPSSNLSGTRPLIVSGSRASRGTARCFRRAA
jgi:hypothetical protein